MSLADPSHRPGRAKAAPGTRAWVRRDYSKLTERERAVLILKLFGAKHREIADRVGCHWKHVSRIVHLRRFQEEYERLFERFGAMFLELGPKALQAFERGLDSGDDNTALRAAAMWFARADDVRRNVAPKASAEDLARHLLGGEE